MVLDKNFNGKADDGSELFGDAMTLPDESVALTGFDALRAYGLQRRREIDASDKIYASLKVPTRLPSWNPFGNPCPCRLSLRGVNG